MNPSTATLARTCRLLIRIKVCGSISDAPAAAGLSPAPRCAVQRLPDARRAASVHGPLHVFEQAVDHGVDGHAVGLGPVAEQDAVPQAWDGPGRGCLRARRGTARASRARAFAPRTSDCAARRPAPQLTHWLTKSGAAGPGGSPTASRTA